MPPLEAPDAAAVVAAAIEISCEAVVSAIRTNDVAAVPAATSAVGNLVGRIKDAAVEEFMSAVLTAVRKLGTDIWAGEIASAISVMSVNLRSEKDDTKRSCSA